jgi:ParB family chromosome partitioning protein
MLSRMTKVARTIPPKVIRFVGPAHGIGRRRWEELADLSLGHPIDLGQLADELPREVAEGSSDDRFARLWEAAAKSVTKQSSTPRASPALLLTSDTGAMIGEIKVSPRALTIRLARNESSGFAEWMREHAEKEILRLYEAWKSLVPSD